MDPLDQSTIAPAPASPEGVSGIPSMSQDEMQANLQNLMSKIDSKYQEFDASKFSSGSKKQVLQGQALREVFDLLQSVGVDPSNVEEVKAFLDKIKESNPELYQQIETALQALIVENTPESIEENPEGLPEESTPPVNMNIQNESPGQNI